MFVRGVSCLTAYSIHVSCMCAIRVGWLSCHFILVVLYLQYSLITYYRIHMLRLLDLCYGNGPMAIWIVPTIYTIPRGIGMLFCNASMVLGLGNIIGCGYVPRLLEVGGRW